MRVFAILMALAALLSLQACASEDMIRSAYTRTHPAPPPTISTSPSRGLGDSFGYSFAQLAAENSSDVSPATKIPPTIQP